MKELPPRDQWLLADFNGYFGEILCLSHDQTSRRRSGEVVELSAGMQVTASEDDVDDDGNPDYLLASGVVAPAPARLQAHGSRWILLVDEDGLQRYNELGRP